MRGIALDLNIGIIVSTNSMGFFQMIDFTAPMPN